MRFLVTGGAGFIGSHFIRYLLNKYPDVRVVNYDKLTYAGNLDNLRDVELAYGFPSSTEEGTGGEVSLRRTKPLLPPFPLRREGGFRYTFVKGDIVDSERVEKIISEYDITHIINFAAESHVDRSIIKSDEFICTNIMGTHTLLEIVRKYGNIRFHHISTDEVYGALGPEDPPFNENSPYRPRSPYSASKAAADHLARAYFHTYNLPVTISNCSNNYGPYQFPEKLHGLFITNLLEGKKVPLYGDGLQVRDWLYVEDHCAAIDAIVQRGRPGETYCVGGGCEKTNLAIARKILALLGQGEETIEYVADRPGHDRRYAIDYRKIQRELGWAPQTDWETGMKKTVAWYQQNTAWWKRLKRL